jgi:hypothetical protein
MLVGAAFGLPSSPSFALMGLAFGAFLACGGTATGGLVDGGSSSSSTGAGGATGTTSSGTGTGGSSSGGGGGPSLCTAGTTSFHMSATNGDNADFCVGLQCSTSWMTVTSMTGEDMPLEEPCETTCSNCMPIGCPALCIAPQTMKPEGESLVWDGTFWQGSTCGAANVSCREKACAAPGRYKVKMCAARRSSDAGPFCMAGASPSCTELEFDYPSSAPVEGTIN